MGNDTAGLINKENKALKHLDYNIFFEWQSLKRILYYAVDVFPSLLLDAINTTYNEPLLMDLLMNPLHTFTGKPKYDVVLVDAVFGEIYLPLVRHLGVPYIMVSSTELLTPLAWHLNVPSYMFINALGLPDTMSLLTREFNGFSISFASLSFGAISLMIDGIVRNFLPNSPPMFELLRNVSFAMTANSYSIRDPLPSTPEVTNLGCVQCRPAKPLPQELEDVMQRSGEHGVIYFSLGSIVKPSRIPSEFKSKVLSVLSRLNQTIVWKGQLSETYPSNFYVRSWFPQQDLLAHPKLRLMITHGGLGTVHEASYHGCPVLGFSLAIDQYYNMYQANKNGYAEYLNWRVFTEDDLFQSVTRILTNKTYKENALRASTRMRDVLDSPAEQAAYWTEYIVRHRGATFLKSEAYHLYWYQYFLLDVLALVVAVTAVAVILCCLTLRLLWKIINRSIQKQFS